VATFAQAGANVDLDALLEEYGLPVRKGQGLVRLASGDPPQEAPGFVQGQLYADALADRLLSRLPDPLAGLEAELAQAQSYEEVRGLLMRRFREASPEEVAALTERALALAGLAGRYSVVRDVER
jgi:phage gp29-like protein